MDLTGQRIADRYDVIRLLGEGGMGQVYEARHVELDKQVAIKFLFGELAEDEELLERFRREARITASLRHVNIVEVMDFGVTSDGLPYLVMEYLTGESLSAILERERTLPVAAAKKIMIQVLSGLSEAHSRGVVHRDLKPDNIYLDEVKGQGQVVKILDFGISKMAAKDGKENLQLTKTGMVMGTPNYMSPEQVMGSVDVDARADLYACGVILFEMLAGRKPFVGETHNEVVVRIMSDPLPDIRTLRADIDDGVVAVVNRALSRDRNARFPAAEELIAALEGVDPDGPSFSLTSLRLTPVPAAPPARRVRRGRIAAIALGIVVLVAVAAAAALLVLGPGQEAGSVTVTPRGAPEATTILLDGQEFTADQPFPVEKDTRPITFTAQAPGYLTGEFEVVPDADRQVRIHLLPVPEADPGAGPTSSPRSEPKAERTETGAQPDKQKKPEKKKSRNPFRALVRAFK